MTFDVSRVSRISRISGLVEASSFKKFLIRWPLAARNASGVERLSRADAAVSMLGCMSCDPKAMLQQTTALHQHNVLRRSGTARAAHLPASESL